ncbi:hypothetical protein HMPREF9625_02070 [Oribacterium parvum ACB1]|uniref:Uncharacterized protein n=1 Tax=Oribacterium parvum ACB1 TaxID=796943 RepID=G9WL13_9FIRM|nr:hypothetical protein [Oribacterium parvum]EHL13257.1 hypothetical protein HMPREF9625_02070 [Oribacterium parvum ACB1]EJF13863.1 hypothetical protein HMPREF1145_1748 [Oribacterium parvum ACB8]
MKIHKSTIISLAFLAVVYLVMQWRGNIASVEKNSRSISETEGKTIKSDREKDQKEAETSSDNSSSENDLKAVYASYLTLLKEKQKDIESYTWQIYEENPVGRHLKMETKGIAITDVYGDSTPELLFIDGSQYDEEGNAIHANLHIYSFQDGKPVEIAKKENLDYQVGGGAVYDIFLTEKNKRLYIEQSEFDARDTEVLYLLSASSSFPLEWDKQASYSYDPEKSFENDATSPQRSDEEFILYDKPVEKTDYYAFKKRIEEKNPKSLISNFGGEEKKESSALSYSEALSFLEKQIQ